jgi:hypothetical protein
MRFVPVCQLLSLLLTRLYYRDVVTTAWMAQSTSAAAPWMKPIVVSCTTGNVLSTRHMVRQTIEEYDMTRRRVWNETGQQFVRTTFGLSSAILVGNIATAPIQTFATTTGPILVADSSLSSMEQLSTNGLANRLRQKDSSLLKNRIFNIQPPSIQVYPTWMRGEWDVLSSFSGFTFPSKIISKERIVQNANIPGFQKCSIASIADIGSQNIRYRYKIDVQNGYEDRKCNLENEINAFLKYQAISNVIYDPIVNPNRISIQFINYKTVNAERVELFCNARESEEYDDAYNHQTIFVCAEYMKQVTFGTGNTIGVPRQVSTNYAHYYTWIWDRVNNDTLTTTSIPPPVSLRGNLLTVAYLDPQDPMYFDEPQQPVAIYSHELSATRRIASIQ